MIPGQACIVAAIGATGSGKSAWVKQQLRADRPPRLFVWDPQNEYADHATARTLPDCGRMLAAGPARVRFVCSDDPKIRRRQFEAYCQLAYAIGGLCAVVDELGDVTGPTRDLTPVWWSTLTRKGRHKGLQVVGLVQRPALVDKNFFSQATLIHCGRLGFAADVRVMADVLAVPADDVARLTGVQWIERDMLTGQTTRGELKFARSRKPKAP